MSRRTAGVLLLFISSLMYSTRYIAAAIFGSSVSSWDAELFNAMLQYVGKELVTWSIIALVAGLAYLTWSEVDAIWNNKNPTNITTNE